jgi:NADH-quinone oxidoreductase subunit G
MDHPFNFEQSARLIVTPHQMVTTLAGIAKSFATDATALSADIQTLLADIHPSAKERQFAEQLKTDAKKYILLGAIANNHPQAAVIRSLTQLIATLSNANVGYITEGANSAGAWLAGAVPHRAAAGVTVNEAGLATQAALAAHLSSYILFNIEPQLDCANGYLANKALQQAEFVMALSAFKSESLLQQANVILPIAAFTENEGAYVNAEGEWQLFTSVVPTPGDSKLGWKILRVLGNQLKINGFEYNTAEQVRAELQALIAKAEVKSGWFNPKSIIVKSVSALMRLTEWPIYSTDSLVRRATALQESATNPSTAIYLNAKLAERLNIKAGSEVTALQGEAKAQLPVILDSRIPENCVWIPAGREETAGLGESFGEIEIRV